MIFVFTLSILFFASHIWLTNHHHIQVYRNFLLANEYQSSKLCEARYTQCEDKMDQLQVLRLPSMAKFNAGFLQCNQSFEKECVGPSKEAYERRMTKVRLSKPQLHFSQIICPLSGLLFFPHDSETKETKNYNAKLRILDKFGNLLTFFKKPIFYM